jgi:kumamolisin
MFARSWSDSLPSKVVESLRAPEPVHSAECRGDAARRQHLRRKVTVRSLTILAIILGATIVSKAQAQSPPVLTRHVRPETLNGQALSIGYLPVTQSMRLTFVLPHRNEAALQQFLKDLYDPSSKWYRKFLTVDEFTAQFGPSQADYDSVIRYAKANGFTVVGTSRNRMNVDVTATADTVERAFHVNMGTYQHPTENRKFFAPDREPTPDLAVQLWHIAGLDNYSTPHPAFARRDQSASSALANSGQSVKPALASPNQSVKPNATIGSGPSASFLGSDIRAAYYGGTALTGSGQSIGLFEFIGTDLADLTTYYSNAGQTNNVPITLLSVDSQSTSCTETTCDDTEQTIDMTQALGMAPGLSRLVMYIGTGGLTGQTIDDAGIFNAMATADPLNAQLSCSWEWKPADSTTDDPYFEEFAAQGQNLFADAGDDGNWANAQFVWPAESEYVTAVGGTELTTTGAGGAWSSETGWPYAGGGISPDDIAIPSWQLTTAAGCANCSETYRNGPDVSAEANFDFYVCADQEACTSNVYGGTTFSTPMWAGYMALVNQQAAINGKPPLGFINPALYAIGLGPNYNRDFHDITSGGNALGTTVGYDLSTGWGSPNGSALIDDLAGSANPAVATTLTYTGPNTFANGSAANPSATLTQTSGGAAVSGVSVLFTLGSGGSAQTCSGTTGSNGAATCSITSVNQTAGGDTISASFAGNSSDDASSAGPLAVTISAAPAVATTLTYNGLTTFTNGSAANPSATLTQTTGGAAVSGVSVLFTLGSGGSAQTCSGTTGSNGTATCSITSVNQTVGSSSILASFAGNSSFLTSSAGPVSVTISAAAAVATTLTYNGPTTFINGSAANPSATLAQTSGGAAVSGVSVLFTLGSGGSAQTCSSTTGSNGTATCTISDVNQTVGADTVSASFAGNSSFLASSAGPVSVTISAAAAVATTLTYTGATAFTDGSAANPSATFTQTSGGAAVSGVSLLFTLGSGSSAQTCSGTTSSSGTATCSIASVSQASGASTISASFAGNASDLASTTGAVAVTITDFTVTAPAGSQTVMPGQTAMYTIVIGSFPGPVTLAASGLPAGVVATFNPNPVVPPETSTVLTITTTAAPATAATRTPRPFGPRGPSLPRSFPIWLAFEVLLLALLAAGVGVAGVARGKPLRRLVPIGALILLIVTAGTISGCAGGYPQLATFNPNVTPAGTYTITVTATSGSDVHMTTVTLIVQ